MIIKKWFILFFIINFSFAGISSFDSKIRNFDELIPYELNKLNKDTKITIIENFNSIKSKTGTNTLVSNWIKLITKYPNTLFLASAGVGNHNLDDIKNMNNSVVSKLISHKIPNLLFVGNINSDGSISKNSNFGSFVEIMIHSNNKKLDEIILKARTVKEAGSLISLKNSLINHYKNIWHQRLKESYFNSCINLASDSCKNLINSIFHSGFLWANGKLFFQKGLQGWSFQSPKIKFSNDLDSEAKLKYNIDSPRSSTTLWLGKTKNLHDLMISLFHEMFHFGLYTKQEIINFSKKKIKNCTTKLQYELAKSEILAFKKEIEFYKSSPHWFKDEVSKLKINSSLLNKKEITYDSYYEELEKLLNKNPKALISHYIRLGYYPKCILNELF